MTTLDATYARLALEVLNYGRSKPSRVGPTRSSLGQSLSTPPVSLTFPIITSRMVYYKGVIGELAAFLQGATMVKEFEAFGCNYWKHNASQWAKNAGKPEEEWEIGRVYGNKWRHWGYTDLDQLQVLVASIKADPYGRRHILTTWDPEELPAGCLPPCHLLAQFHVNASYLDCSVYMRSVDIALGLPSDLVLYGALLMLVAKQTGYQAGRLHFHFGDAHIYEAHAAELQTQANRICTNDLPLVELAADADLFSFNPKQFTLTDYYPQEAIKYELF